MYVYKIYLTDQKVYTPEVYKTMKEAEKAADQLDLSFMISVLLANTPIPLSNFDTDNYFIRHGGAYDRGSADSYYERSAPPTDLTNCPQVYELMVETALNPNLELHPIERRKIDSRHTNFSFHVHVVCFP